MTRDITKTLTKHIAAIHNSAPLNATQRKVMNIFLENALRDDFESKVHKLSMNRLMQELGWSSTSKVTDLLKNDLKELAKIQVEWNVLKADRKNKWVAMQLLAEVGIENGEITYAYPPTLKELLFNPNIYAKLDLNTQKELTTRYAVALWEFLSGEFSIKQQINVKTTWLEYRTLLKIFGLSSSVYELRYSDFMKKILDPAIQDVSLKSQFFVSYEINKDGRKVSHVQFHAQKKDDISQPINVSPVITNFKEETIKTKLESLGFNTRFINSVVKNYKHEEIEIAIDIFEKALQEGKIKYPVAFLKKALEEGWVTSEIMTQRVEISDTEKNLSEKDALLIEIQASEEAEQIKALRVELLKLLGFAPYQAWMHKVSMRLDFDTLRIIAPTSFRRDRIESHYRQDIRLAAEKCFERNDLRIEFKLMSEKDSVLA